MDETYGNTKNQHYVPQTYLRGFKSSVHNEKDYIYFIDKQKNDVNREVQILNVAFEKYFYEFRDNNNNIFLKNYNEKHLSKYESLFNEYKNKTINSFVNSSEILIDEKQYWFDFITLQMLRIPMAFEISAKVFKFDERTDLTKYEKKNILLCEHFPFSINKSTKNNLFIDIRDNVIKKMHFQIMFAPSLKDYLITSDNPINVIPNLSIDSYYVPYEMIYFPLCSRFGIVLSKKSLFEGCTERKKRFHKMVDLFNGLVYCSANRFVYSDRPISKDYIDKIKKAFKGNSI